MKFYEYPKCSTCRNAKKWLIGAGLDFESVHLVSDTPSRSEIERLWKASGLDLKRFFNTSGGSYRALNLKETYKDLSDVERLDLLADDGMLIKRPILESGDKVFVGFKEAEYSNLTH